MMRILPAATGLDEALAVLRDGGIVAHATETCYGFACDLSNPDAVTNLFVLKNRSFDQPVSALFASAEEAKKFVEWNDRAEELAKKHLPGPLTLILPFRSNAPYRLFPLPPPAPIESTQQPNFQLSTLNSQLSLGVRVSSHPLAQRLAAAFGNPLSTTSANLHGQPNPYSIDDIVRQFENEEIQPDLILDSGVLTPTPPSTVIDLTNEGRTLRKGTI
jgi:L-threonylcarbamoyladenylate synthase